MIISFLINKALGTYIYLSVFWLKIFQIIFQILYVRVFTIDFCFQSVFPFLNGIQRSLKYLGDIFNIPLIINH